MLLNGIILCYIYMRIEVISLRHTFRTRKVGMSRFLFV